MRFSAFITRVSARAVRHIHTSPPLNQHVWQVWGANTNVGKTVLCAALLRHCDSPSVYIKPIQTGFPADDDTSYISRYAPQTQTHTLHSYEDPVSPDLAAALDQHVVSDEQIRYDLVEWLGQYHVEEEETGESPLTLIETAGGVLSPAPSGVTQADLYRAFRFPAMLVGDFRLGGISTTLSAYEALRTRGYDVPVVVVFADRDETLENEQSIEKQVHSSSQVFCAPRLPPLEQTLDDYMQHEDVISFCHDLADHLKALEKKRFAQLQIMKEKVKDIIWYPFTQHSQLNDVTCIDSAYDNYYTTYDATNGLRALPDTAGGWWTNGVGHGNSQMARAVGNAVGRYGHVLFPENIHEPAYQLAEQLISGVGQGWASRVFYSDNGSTALEVALKMAFRKRLVDHSHLSHLPMKIIALHGGYHGDTLGAMSCAPESDYNATQIPWYEPRGLFFEPPVARLEQGVWVVQIPKWVGEDFDIAMSNRDELFSTERDVSFYQMAIRERLNKSLAKGDCNFGALLLEPVMQAAGGMIMIDPAFQRTLVNECRKLDIPVVFDEVFSGLWRLGHESAGSMIGSTPDVSAFGKLLTGGTVPLAVTLASEEVFEKFIGESKRDALLHGHSFTAHAVGCAASVEAFKQYQPLVDAMKTSGIAREYWSEACAKEISSLSGVDGVTVLGTVCSVHLSNDEQGYSAMGAKEVVQRIRRKGVYARPLGNVVYMMCNPLTEEAMCKWMMQTFMDVLEEWSAEQNGSPEASEIQSGS